MNEKSVVFFNKKRCKKVDHESNTIIKDCISHVGSNSASDKH